MVHTILVPLDGSQRAEAILPYVQELATCMLSHVILIAVIEPIMMPVTSEVVMYAEDMVQHRQDLETYLDQVAAELQAKGVAVDTGVILGQPVQEIVETARHLNVDLIAMSSHGRTGLAQVIFGSVAAGVLHQIDRPILLVRATD